MKICGDSGRLFTFFQLFWTSATCQEPFIPLENKGSSKRISFSPEEDVLLTNLIKNFGSENWEFLASFLPRRNARQCKERWRMFLSPDIKNGPWSKEEDQLLIDLVTKNGPKWTKLIKYFTGRSECNIKNRWSRYLRNNKKTDPNVESLQIFEISNFENNSNSFFIDINEDITWDI